ncbi:histidine kinase [Streptomyces sp. NPDC127072]|uniref:ATP-binding protein n=1 Tax=Streptomyces sp. NPDC127072 TaxID=3347129 RepID=UPI003649BEE7
MDRTRNWALPGLLAAVQVLLLWPGSAATDIRTPGPVGLVGLLVAVAVETVALSRRRHLPVRALSWTLGASVLGQATAYDAYADLALTVALFSVAVRCSASVTARALAAAVGSALLSAAVHSGFHIALASQLALQAALYVSCAGLGQARRQWLARRLAADRLLALAEERRRQAGETERGRLARELHDVSAHHLTSVVVTVDVARRLGDRKPELVAEALEFAERTGRETLTAIHRLVAVMREAGHADSQPMTGRIQDLVSGFGRLGRPIATELPDDLVGPAADAVHGIVREALTNVLRYAPGAAVRVVVRREDGTLELTVDNTAARGPAPYGGMGSGRGLAGMRERAVAVGGELTAGAGPDGGWRVRAVLPDIAGPGQAAVRPRRRDFPRERRLTDSAFAFSTAVLPLFVVLLAVEERELSHAGTGPWAIGLVSALFALHALPLPWRRRAPWWVLAGVLATSWLWPVACLSAGLPGSLAQFMVGGLMAETLAVHTLGAYGRGAAYTWPAPFVAAGSTAGALTATAAADGALIGEAPSVLTLALVVVPLGTLLLVLFASVWGVGLIVRSRRLGVVARDDFALSRSVWQAETAAGAERHRLATRLRDAVLHRTAALVELARQGRLDEVATEARAALAAMRELLHDINEINDINESNDINGGDGEGGGGGGRGEGGGGGGGGGRDPRGARDGRASVRPPAPQPTVADLDALCRRVGPSGRKVTVRGVPGAAEGLPAPVILTVYRMVEAALGAGDRRPARVGLRRRRGALHLTITGVRLAVTGPVAERLRAQATAGEGLVTLEPVGTVRALLPLPAVPSPAPAQEVSPSPHA